MEPFVAEPFVALMRRYCIDYTARHDLSVCDDIMDPGYTLHMGTHDLAGRDDAYKPAAASWPEAVRIQWNRRPWRLGTPVRSLPILPPRRSCAPGWPPGTWPG